MVRLWSILMLLLPYAILTQAAKPHIITILVDDLGWNDVGFHGSDQIKTPNIDALAYSGMILNRHYVLPSCTPSRTALLTGTYPIRTGMQGYPLKAGENRNLPISFQLAPEYMRSLGYHTHMVGKWHLGFETRNHVPNHRGFDSFFGYYTGYVDYYKFGYNQTVAGDKIEHFYGYDLHLNDDAFWTNGETYATKLFTDRAESIIRSHNGSEPLYLYFSHLATHTGHDDIGMEIPKNSDVNETYSHIRDYQRRAFAGCLEDLDNSVGTVVKALKDKNMLENSIILFLSDNGGHTVSIDMPPNWSSNWPLGGTKFTMYEGGVRGAAVLWSPLLPKGVVHNDFMHIIDWLPTLYSAAGGDPATLNSKDGIDQWESLKKITAVKRDNILINIDDKVGAEGVIVNNRWKVIKGGNPNYGNYDYHWGADENVKPNPEYDTMNILESQTGTLVQGLKDYQNVLTERKMLELREKSMIRCQVSENKIPVQDGFIPASNNFRCPDFCVFDIINDPCELEVIHNDEVLKLGKRILEDYKQKMILQGDTKVDPDSNPKYFGGVWTPWNQHYAKSFAGDFGSLNFCFFLIFIITWYTFRK